MDRCESATLVHCSPKDKLIDLIGRVGGELHELSPIAHHRDTLNGVETTGFPEVQGHNKEGISSLETCKNEKSYFFCRDTEKKQLGQSGDATEKKILADADQVEKYAKASLVLTSGSASPLSPSSEFSLETLRDNEKSVCDNLHLDSSPILVEKKEGLDCTFANIADVGPTDGDCSENRLQEMEETAHIYEYYESMTSSKTTIQPFFAQNEEEEKKGYEHIRCGKFAGEIDDECSIDNKKDSQMLLQRNANLGGQSTLTSDDDLVHDATEKVKRFIRELSLNSSKISLDDDLCSQEGKEDEEVSTEDQSKRDHSEAIDRYVASSKNSFSCFRTVKEEKENDSISFAERNGTSMGGSFYSCSREENLLHSLKDKNCPEHATDWSSPVRRRESSSEAGSRTPGSQDLSEAKKKLGASSYAFLNHVRGAAQRRKQNFTRSRDSLVAKEQRHREEIAASKKAIIAPEMILLQASPSRPFHGTARNVAFGETRTKSFKARPAPATNGDLGIGGLSGVPKVVKKPTTLPSSPLLGARRPNRPKIKALQEPSTKPWLVKRRLSMPLIKKSLLTAKRDRGRFKARTVPHTTGQAGRSGQAGVPKVPKRPVTVASSPCLGPRRRCSSVSDGKENQKQARRVSTGMILKAQSKHATAKASPMVSNYERHVIDLCFS